MTWVTTLTFTAAAGAVFMAAATARAGEHNDFPKPLFPQTSSDTMMAHVPALTKPAVAVTKVNPLPVTPQSTAIDCTRAASIIAEYAFGDVAAVNCEGSVYNFTATREGKQYTIQISALNGDLTQVQKIVPNVVPTGDPVKAVSTTQ